MCWLNLAEREQRIAKLEEEIDWLQHRGGHCRRATRGWMPPWVVLGVKAVEVRTVLCRMDRRMPKRSLVFWSPRTTGI
jgi:hypothetical protein